MKVAWICGLPEEVRLLATPEVLTPNNGAAWGWILGHLPPPNGVELHIICPVRNLLKKEIDFTYLGARWHCCREIRGEQYLLRFLVICRVRKLLQTIKPDIVNGWGGETGCGWIAVRAAKRACVNVQGLLRMLKANERIAGITAKRGRRIDWLFRELVEVLTYSTAKRLFVESRQSQMCLKHFYGYDSDLIYQPLQRVFLDTFSASRKEHTPTFLFVGELVERKGPMDVLKAFVAMKGKSAKLIVVGAGPLEKSLWNFARENNIVDRVSFYRGLPAESIVELMQNSDFFILPSYGDTGPTALKEALSQGLYPICYDNTGPKEHIERYGFGAMGETGKWESLIPLMDNACICREELRIKGCRAATRVKRDLSPVNIWPKLLSAYQEVVAYA